MTKRSTAAWLAEEFRALDAARKAGDEAGALRIAERVRREGTRAQARLFDQALNTGDEMRFRAVIGETGGVYQMGAAEPGRRLCDFCGDPDPTCYFPATEFYLHTDTATIPSGDKFYACAICEPLIEAADWKALREHCGVGSRETPVRMLWAGFARNRTGPAVPVDAAGEPLT